MEEARAALRQKLREKRDARTGKTQRQAKKVLRGGSAKDTKHEAYLAHKMLKNPEKALKKLGVTDPAQMQQLKQLVQGPMQHPAEVAKCLTETCKESPPPEFM